MPEPKVLMLLENNPYPDDIRVRREAETLTAAGHRVTVVAPRRAGQPRREVVRGVEVRRFRLREGSGALGLLFEYAVAHCALLAAAVRGITEGYAAIHIHNPPDTLFPAGLLARLFGRKVVYDHHDLAPELFEQKFGPGWLVRVLALARTASAQVAHVTVVTNDSQALAVARAWPPAGSRTVVVRNGPLLETIAARASIRPGALSDPRLVFVGALETQDGILEIPELLQAIDDELGSRSTCATVVGDGTARMALERRLAEVPSLAGRVHLTGWVPHEAVAGLISTADIAIDPAPATPLNHGSTMIKIGEYLAGGCPTVAYRLRETVATGGDAVRYVGYGDPRGFARAVAEIARDERLRRRLSQRALARARTLTWEHSAAELERVYDSLLRSSAAGDNGGTGYVPNAARGA